MENKKFVFILTKSHENPDVVAGAMQLAANMKSFDMEVDFFLMDSGARLALKGFAETLVWQKKDEFSPVAELMRTLTEMGVKWYICASCVKSQGLDKAEKIENSEVKPGSFLAEMLAERQALTF